MWNWWHCWKENNHFFIEKKLEILKRQKWNNLVAHRLRKATKIATKLLKAETLIDRFLPIISMRIWGLVVLLERR